MKKGIVYHNWKLARGLVCNLIGVITKGANYLLKVGPSSEGLIPEPSVVRLKVVKKWLRTNDEAMYKTEKLKSDRQQGKDISFAKSKGKNVYYAICL